MKFYARLFALNLKSQMQYKFSLFLSCLGQFITAFTSFFSVQFIFMQINSVNNFTYGQVLLCFAVIMLSFSIGEAVGGGLTTFPRMVNIGEFDRILTRPRNYILQVIIPLFDFTRIGLLVQGGIVLAMAIPQSGVVWTVPKVITLILMIVCGAVLFLIDDKAHPAYMFVPCLALIFIVPCWALFKVGIRKYKSAGS